MKWIAVLIIAFLLMSPFLEFPKSHVKFEVNEVLLMKIGFLFFAAVLASIYLGEIA